MTNAVRAVPSWLRLKSQLRAGDKIGDLGPGDQKGTVTVPSWLKVKSQLRAGDKIGDLGLNAPESTTLARLVDHLRLR